MAITSIVATLGSLYFSEIQMYVPCELCWYQRILMYPLILITVIGIKVKDRSIGVYTTIFSGIGVLLSGYHYLIQKVGILGDSLVCKGVTCTVQYINWLGFITIPFLSFTAFTIILILSVMYLKNKGGKNKDGE